MAHAHEAGKWLRDRSVHHSSSDFDQHGWYTSANPEIDYFTGSEKLYGYHPVGFNEKELQHIHSVVTGKYKKSETITDTLKKAVSGGGRALKIYPEHARELIAAIGTVSKRAPNMESEYKEKGLSHERYRWDKLHASGYDTNKLYNAGLNDKHIDSALKWLLGSDYHDAKKSETTMDIKTAVKKAITKKAMQWLAKTFKPDSVVVDSGVDKAASGLNKATSPDYVDFEEEIKKSEDNALTKWSPCPFVPESLRKGDGRTHDPLAHKIFNKVVQGKNVMTPKHIKTAFSTNGNHIAELTHGVGISGEKIFGVTVVSAARDTGEWKHNHDRSKMFHSRSDAENYMKELKD